METSGIMGWLKWLNDLIFGSASDAPATPEPDWSKPAACCGGNDPNCCKPETVEDPTAFEGELDNWMDDNKA